MKELQIFNSEEFGRIRSVVIDNEPWFVGNDVAKALGYSKVWDAIKTNVDEMDTSLMGVMDSLDRKQQTTIINESGLYSLIFGSKLETAKQFKRWVTSEVLPALRKTGTYSVTTTCQYPVSAAIESATNAGRLFERIMKSEGIPPHEIAMAVRDIFLQAGINVPDYVIRIPAYEQLAMTFGKSGEVACSGHILWMNLCL